MSEAIIQPVTERGVIVDVDGYFMAAWQWAEGNPPKMPRTPNNPALRLIMLREPEALDPPSEKAKWDFEKKVWLLPDFHLWIVDEQGNVRGGETYWPKRLQPLQPGWLYVDKEPPNEEGARPIWDRAANEWKLPRRVYIGASGLVEDVVLENPNDDTPDAYIPEGMERIADSRDPVDDVDGAPVGIGCVRLSGGKWRNIAKEKVSKKNLMAALTKRRLASAFTRYLEKNELRDEWQALDNDAEISGHSHFVSKFLAEEKKTPDEMIEALDEAKAGAAP